MKKHIWTICFSAVLFAYTLYVVLDTFVIRRVYDANAVKVNTSMFATPLPSAASTALPSDPDDPEEETALPDVNTYVPTATAEPTPVQPYQDEDSYVDENITIELSTYEEYGTAIYVADVRLSSAEYLKTAFAQNKYGRNITEFTSEIARTNEAILAVNGDYYGVQKKGFVIRNGVVYRDSARGEDVLCIYADGTVGIVSDTERTADELVES
ncbi:MAG: phosphodiester glycosidase family protein, partial [Clostridia bacterium]|nr:phosphodiester glycosidase family protein [Clostridia bacterium]